MKTYKPKFKFNFLDHKSQPTELPDNDFLKVRTRAKAVDRFGGLKGKDYIAARGLGKLQTSAQSAEVKHG